MKAEVQSVKAASSCQEQLAKSKKAPLDDANADAAGDDDTEVAQVADTPTGQDISASTSAAAAPVAESIDPLESEVQLLAEIRIKESVASKTESLDEARIAVKRQLAESVFQRLRIVDRESAKQEKGVRFNAVHVHGVNHMSTDEIRAYFSAYPPTHVEWLDDRHANVVWKNDALALRALIYMSLPDTGNDGSTKSASTVKETKRKKKIAKKSDSVQVVAATEDDSFSLHSNDEKHDGDVVQTAQVDSRSIADAIVIDDGEGSDEEQEKSESEEEDAEAKAPLSGDSEEEKQVPEGFWLRGRAFHRSHALFLRYATRYDRKKRGADKRSDFYRRKGNPNFFGITGVISHSYRQLLRGNDPRAIRVAKFKDPDDFVGKRWSGYDLSQSQEVATGADDRWKEATATSPDVAVGEEPAAMDHVKELELLLGKRQQLVSMQLVSDVLLGESQKVAAAAAWDDEAQMEEPQSGKTSRKRPHDGSDLEEERRASVHSRLGPRCGDAAKSRRVESAQSAPAPAVKHEQRGHKPSTATPPPAAAPVVKQEPLDPEQPAVVSRRRSDREPLDPERPAESSRHRSNREPLDVRSARQRISPLGASPGAPGGHRRHREDSAVSGHRRPRQDSAVGGAGDAAGRRERALDRRDRLDRRDARHDKRAEDQLAPHRVQTLDRQRDRYHLPSPSPDRQLQRRRHDFRERRDVHDIRDRRDGRNVRDDRDGRNVRDDRDGRNVRDGRDDRNGRDGRDGRDGHHRSSRVSKTVRDNSRRSPSYQRSAPRPSAPLDGQPPSSRRSLEQQAAAAAAAYLYSSRLYRRSRSRSNLSSVSSSSVTSTSSSSSSSITSSSSNGEEEPEPAGQQAPGARQ